MLAGTLLAEKNQSRRTLEGVEKCEGHGHPLHAGDEVGEAEHPRQSQDAQQGKGA